MQEYHLTIGTASCSMYGRERTLPPKARCTVRYVRFHIGLTCIVNIVLAAAWSMDVTPPENLLVFALGGNMAVGIICASLYIVVAKDAESLKETVDFYAEFNRAFWHQEDRRKQVEERILEVAQLVVAYESEIEALKVNGLGYVRPELLRNGKSPGEAFDEFHNTLKGHLNAAETKLKEHIELVHRASTRFPTLRHRKVDEYLDLAEKKLKERPTVPA